MTTTHMGLYFSSEQVAAAKAGAESAPLAEAWAALRERQPVTPLDYAFRSVFLNAPEHAERALGGLLRAANMAADGEYIARVASLVSALQTFAMIRAEPGLEAGELATWLDYGAEAADDLLTTEPLPAHEAAWRNLLRLTSALVLKRPEQAQASAAEFARVIAEEVRPQGHLAKLVLGEDGGSLFRQIEATAALVLTAEAGQHAGLGLWDIEVRGVSVLTTALMPHYYFYDTRRWKWDRGVPPEDVQAHFHRFGGYLEMANRRAPNKDIQIVLEDLRPLNTPLAGGWTTLSHGVAEKKRRGLFG